MMGAVLQGGSGYFAVDRDNPDAELPGELPPTLRVKTAQGFHDIFLHPGKRVKNSAKQLAPGVDIRGDGGWIVGPGSPHRTGAVYTVVQDLPIARAPQWLLDWPGLYKDESTSGEHSPGALEPGTPLYQRAVDFLVDYCKTTDHTDGSAALLSVGRIAMQCQIHPDLSTPLVAEHFNPRATNARTGETVWDEGDIHRKMVQSWRNEFNLPVGLGWMGNDLEASLVEAGKLKVLKVPAITGTRMQVKNPEHIYSFVPGYNEPEADARKASPQDLVRVLVNNPEWEGVLQYDEFAESKVAVNPPLRLDLETKGLTGRDLAAIQLYMHCKGLAAGIPAIENAVEIACSRNSHHPILTYLEGLDQDVDPCDAKIYLEGLAKEWFGDECTEVESGYLAKFLVGSVRRVIEPGTEMHSMIVLYGKGGVGKSRWVKDLFGSQWTKSQMPSLDGRDASHALEGMWAIEIGELASLLRTETSAAKEFLSRNIDKYRGYGTAEKIVKPRSCVFIGTTNEASFLRDSTGNRRFQPIRVTQPIPATLDRDRVWAAALALSKTDYRHWETSDESEANEVHKADFVETDMWHEPIEQFLGSQGQFVQLNDVYNYLTTHMGTIPSDQRTQKRIADTLRRLGCERVVKRAKGKPTRYWEVPEHLQKKKADPAKPPEL